MILNYRRDIDGMRAIAILAVLFFHAFPTIVPGGFIGVDVFFVISGFLISSIIFQQITDNQFRWTTFYIKRINRLFPALIIVLLSALIAGYFLLFADEYQNLSKHILGSSFFLNNILLWKEAGYFDVISEFKPLLHLWSLGIEEQFYLVWPFFILLLWNKKLNPFIAIILIITLSFLLNLLSVTHHGIATFYLPLTRFWELGLGGAIAYVSSLVHKPVYKDSSTISTKQFFSGLEAIDDSSKKSDVPYFIYGIQNPTLLNILSITSLCTLLLTIFYFRSTLSYPGWAALLPTVCTAVLLCTQTTWINRCLLAKPSLAWVGVISYPLYLWHWELFSFSHIILSGTLPYFLTLILLILSFFLAWLTYYFVEKPIRCSVKGKQYASFSAYISLFLLLSLGGMSFVIYINHGLESRVLAQTQKKLNEDMTHFEHYRKEIYPCEVTNKATKNLDWCLQTRKGAPNKVIWGDSHADHLLPGFLRHDQQNNWLLLGQSSCPPLMDTLGFWIGFKDTCAQTNETALETILASSSIDTVVLASLGPFYISDQGYAMQHLQQYSPKNFILQSKNKAINTDKATVFYEGLELTINKLHTAGKKVILFQDIPEIPFMPDRCLHRPLAPRYPCYINKKDVLERQKSYKALLVKLKEKHPDILVFNSIEVLCPQQSCSLLHKRHLIYRDSHHLSITGSQFVGKQFMDWIKQQ